MLRQIAFFLGIRSIQIATSPGTDLDKLLITKMEPKNDYHILVLNDKDATADNLKFTLGDLDSF